jgi:hypothetical protein
MSFATNRPTWILRFPFLVSIALGLASLAMGIAWKFIDGGVLPRLASPGYHWIILVSGILSAQIGLVLAISAGFSASNGMKWRTALPGLAASGAALVFWALIR